MKFTLVNFVVAMVLQMGFGSVQADGILKKSAPIHISNGSASLDVIVDRRIIHFRDPDQSNSLQNRVNSLQSLLNSYFSDHARESSYTFTFGEYKELNARMASTASCSGQWDAKAGRVPNDKAANWLRVHLTDENAFRELIPIFDEVGYKIEIASIESISLCRPHEIDWANTPRLCKSPLANFAKLPCGALLTFNLKSK